MGRLKSTVYARMEEMSFRSGAAVTGGVLAAAGAAITLDGTLVPGGAPVHGAGRRPILRVALGHTAR